MPLNLRFNESAIVIFLSAACSLPAQVSVQSGKAVRVPAADATSAVSIDLHIAEATITDGQMVIHGVDAGDTLVVALGESGPHQIPVHVFPAEPAYPPGFVPPIDTSAQTGSLETRYNSDRTEFENVVDLSTRAGQKTTQLHAVSASFAGEPGHSIFLPSAFYRVQMPESDITLLDQFVNQSPLTIENAIIRGLHIRKGTWMFHGGYTTSAEFADGIIPTENEIAAGMSRASSLGRFVSLTPSIYFLRSIDMRDGELRSAFIASLLFNFNVAESWHISAEIADGRGLAWSGAVSHNGDHNRLIANFTQKKSNFPSLRTSRLPGLSGDASWSQTFSTRLSLDSGASVNNISLPAIHQDSRNGFATLRYKFAPSWSAGMGASYGSFTTVGSFSARTLTLPQFVGFDRARFGAGLQYQFSVASDSFSTGNGLRQTARLNRGRFQFNQYFGWQRDALSLNALYSQLPSLQQTLGRMGLTAGSSDQLAASLKQAEFLHMLVHSSAASIVTVPSRVQAGGGLTWASSGARPHQLSVSVLADHNRFAASDARDYNVTGAYTKAISASNQLQAGWSLVSSTVSGRQFFSPLISASFRHTFSYTPGMWTQNNGDIAGTVFIDSSRQGFYRAGMETVAKAPVMLDGQRTILTDANGHFRFNGVSAGSHRVELRYRAAREHYFTTASDANAVGGSTVDFGIAFPRSDLWGYVEDDAGNGLAGVQVWIVGRAAKAAITTDRRGKFLTPDAQPGDYEIDVDAESLPLGYSAEGFDPVKVTVTAASAPHPVLKIPATRVLTGTVTIYDATAGSYIPVRDAVVSIPALDRQVTTGASGVFTFSGLPAGDLQIRMAAVSAAAVRIVTLPAQPITLRADFRISSLNGEIVSTVLSTP